MKNAMNQIPIKKNPKKNATKMNLASAPNKARQPSKRQGNKYIFEKIIIPTINICYVECAPREQIALAIAIDFQLKKHSHM